MGIHRRPDRPSFKRKQKELYFASGPGTELAFRPVTDLLSGFCGLLQLSEALHLDVEGGTALPVVFRAADRTDPAPGAG